MQYCNWCHLESDTDDFCIWCKRPFSGGPSLFNLPKKADIHFLGTEDDSSDMQVPVYAILGIVVFIGILTVAFFTLRPHDAVAQAQPAVTDVGDLKNTGPGHVLTDAERWRMSGVSGGSGSGGGGGPVLAPTPNRSTVAQRAPAPPPRDRSNDIWKDGIPFGMKPVALSTMSDTVPDGPKANTIFFETAKFNLQNDSKGVLRLTGDIVIVNDAPADVNKGQLWIKIGSSRFPLRRFGGKLDELKDLGPVVLPASSHVEFYVYADGYKKELNIWQQKTIGLDGLISGAPFHMYGDITNPRQ